MSAKACLLLALLVRGPRGRGELLAAGFTAEAVRQSVAELRQAGHPVRVKERAA